MAFKRSGVRPPLAPPIKTKTCEAKSPATSAGFCFGGNIWGNRSALAPPRWQGHRSRRPARRRGAGFAAESLPLPSLEHRAAMSAGLGLDRCGLVTALHRTEPLRVAVSKERFAAMRARLLAFAARISPARPSLAKLAAIDLVGANVIGYRPATHRANAPLARLGPRLPDKGMGCRVLALHRAIHPPRRRALGERSAAPFTFGA